jgi:Na+-translocating ferredoxin:NAD+ oxidoreductase subunit C
MNKGTVTGPGAHAGEKIRKRGFGFSGGFRLPHRKELSRDAALENMPHPAIAVVPMRQHAGAPAVPSVEIGQLVHTGERIGVATDGISAHIHAPISGKVLDIREQQCAGGKTGLCVVIENDGEDSVSYMPSLDALTAEPELLLRRIEDAGIVGLGGATFPSAVKLEVPTGKSADTLLLNGIECEPYLTADGRLMQERGPAIVRGIQTVLRLLNINRAIVGIEDHNRKALAAMREAAAGCPQIVIQAMKTKYPQGQEKMLIRAATGRTVALGKLPIDVGVIVHNVGTIFAIDEAITLGKPLIERVVAVSGEAIASPKNLLVRVGTPVRELIAYCGGCTANEVAAFAGGPMMGATLESLDYPTEKGISGIVIVPASAVKKGMRYPCIHCGACSRACPMQLSPSLVADHAESGNMAEAKAAGVLACCNCGLCSVVCPSNRPSSATIWSYRSLALKK